MPPEDDGQDLAGYNDIPSLVQGYRASSEEGKRQKQRADQLEQRIQQIESQFTRQQVPTRANPADRLSEFGIPVDAIDELISERVARGVQEAFGPIVKGASARNRIMTEYKDYTKYEADVAAYIAEDPQREKEYHEAFQQNPLMAMENAFLKFGEAKRASTPNGAEPQRKARAEAQIPSARQGDARTLPNSDPADLASRTWEHYQKTGDPRAYAKARLGQIIKDDFLRQ